MENKIHLWQGEWIDSNELKLRVNQLNIYANKSYNLDFPLQEFLDACHKLGNEFKNKTNAYDKLLKIALENTKMSHSEIVNMFEVITEFMNKEVLIKKLKNELGVDDPFEVRRLNFKEHQFEGYAPLGLLVHVTPSNVFTVSVLCLIEGLLTGNMNFLKTSSNESLLPQHFFDILIGYDKSNKLKNYIIIARISSKESDLLKQILSYADGVSAWGSEEAIKSISTMTPEGVKVIKWGHKISFGFISKEYLNNEVELIEMAKDVCRIEQQACSSPQNLYVEINSKEELVEFAERFINILEKVSLEFPITIPDFDFQAELTNVIEVAKAEESLGLTKVYESKNKTERVIVDFRKALRASPLYRTIWIKPLLASEIIETLYPMRSYLQTVGLSCPIERLGELSKLFFKAGVLRINKAGSMLAGYIGEPHDGKFALIEFMKRISVNMDDKLKNYSSLYEFNNAEARDLSEYTILSKDDFQNLKVDDKYIELIVKSGGSSGKTVYSYFTWDDYHNQMLNTAYGLYAAGLDPKTDRVINLFAAGNLYGGFISFFTILEFMQIKQYPMGIVDDLTYIGTTIVKNNINTIISVPSFIIKLFQANHELFMKNQVVKKIFYGGEHFTSYQKSFLFENYGIELIRSAVYGSNDAGPIGFQCEYCEGSEHHLLTNLQEMEIFDINSDTKINNNEVGRIILTSKKRVGQAINRYEIGDLGRILDKQCKCGRTQPLFELLGRTGDVFKAGGPFLNYNRFVQIIEKEFDYSGNLQIVLEAYNETTLLTLVAEENLEPNDNYITEILLEEYSDLNFSVKELNLKLKIERVDIDKFVFVEHSGKLKKIIDRRI